MAMAVPSTATTARTTVAVVAAVAASLASPAATVATAVVAAAGVAATAAVAAPLAFSRVLILVFAATLEMALVLPFLPLVFALFLTVVLVLILGHLDVAELRLSLNRTRLRWAALRRVERLGLREPTVVRGRRAPEDLHAERGAGFCGGRACQL
jgi:hypothetical protein